VNLSPYEAAFSEEHSELTERIDNSGCRLLADYSFHSTMSREGDFNWKVWIEGYQECYHCPTIHPVFLNDFALTRYSVENCRQFSVHSCERKVKSASGAFEGLWLWVYPNLGLPIYEPAFYTLQVNPLDVNRTRLTYTFHARKSTSAAVMAEFLRFVDQITQEDISICQAVQKNLNSGVFHHGVLNPARENGVIYFQSLVRQAVVGTSGSISLDADATVESAHHQMAALSS
jgi:phenylpropionate dioxygenase-like ring-hydroxylating dioxygenase large terminal subunit